MNRFTEALSACERSLRIREKEAGTNHLDTARSLVQLSTIYTKLGKYEVATELCQRSLEIREKALGTESEEVAECLGNLAYLRQDQGRIMDALALYQRSRRITETVSGSNTYEAAVSLSNEATVHETLGNFTRARQLIERSLTIIEEARGPQDPAVASVLCNLGTCCAKEGDSQKAFRSFKRSFEIFTNAFGYTNLEVAVVLCNMAHVAKNMNKWEEARDLLVRAMCIEAALLGEDHPSVSDSLESLAVVWAELGDLREAVGLQMRCLEIREKAFKDGHFTIARGRANLARLVMKMGRYEEALRIFKIALEMNRQYFEEDDWQTIYIIDGIADCYFSMEDYSNGVAILSENLHRKRELLTRQFLGRSPQETLRFVEVQFKDLWRIPSAPRQQLTEKKLASLGAQQFALNKAVLEESQSGATALDVSPRVFLHEMRSQWEALYRQLNSLPEAKLAPEVRQKARKRLQCQIDELERSLSEQVKWVKQSIQDRQLTLADIASDLPHEAVLVDLVQFLRFDFTAKTNQWKEQRYAAYLTFPLAKDSTNLVVTRVDLGDAAPINEAVETLSRRLGAGQYRARDVEPALQRLSALVYAPLGRHLTNVSHLIVCPDGQLSRLPFEMLSVPSGGTNRWLVEEKTISYVSSGREVARIAARTARAKSKPQLSKSLVVGNPDFDLDLGKADAATAAAIRPAASSGSNDFAALTEPPSRTPFRSRSFTGATFQPLAGSAREAQSVASLLGTNCTLLTGPDARETALRAVVSPRVLHLATHGFYLKDQEFQRTNALRDLMEPPLLTMPGRRFAGSGSDWENPLIRCGIALAGANHAAQVINAVAEDGILTGLEASLLNLQGTELVILSACDSGAGEVKIGEGVMSLRRAFTIAGAESVLASHWKVNDEATSRLMTDFMRRWRAGTPRAQAWREAQLEMLRSKDFANPYFWAAFTLTGQWQ